MDVSNELWKIIDICLRKPGVGTTVVVDLNKAGIRSYGCVNWPHEGLQGYLHPGEVAADIRVRYADNIAHQENRLPTGIGPVGKKEGEVLAWNPKKMKADSLPYLIGDADSRH
jgi:hypothetical protein